MQKYTCLTCNRDFNKKEHLINHSKKKFTCVSKLPKTTMKPPNSTNLPPFNTNNSSDNFLEFTKEPMFTEIATIPLPLETIKEHVLTEIGTVPLPIETIKERVLTEIGTVPLPAEIIKEHIPNNNYNCSYCNKQFSRKDVANKHMKNNCNVFKQQNKEKQEIFEKLKLLEDHNRHLEDKIKNLENKFSRPNITNNTQNNNTINNVDNRTNIIMVSYGNEDLSKITPKMLSTACKKGYNSIVQLVETVHFNPNFPEFHNVYIPSVKDKHAMIFYDDVWNLKNKDEVVNDMYDTNRDYIIENIEGISNLLNDGEKRALNRWLDSEKNKDKSDKDKKAIECTRENLKLLLHNKRHIPIGTRKQKATITM